MSLYVSSLNEMQTKDMNKMDKNLKKGQSLTSVTLKNRPRSKINLACNPPCPKEYLCEVSSRSTKQFPRKWADKGSPRRRRRRWQRRTLKHNKHLKLPTLWELIICFSTKQYKGVDRRQCLKQSQTIRHRLVYFPWTRNWCNHAQTSNFLKNPYTFRPTFLYLKTRGRNRPYGSLIQCHKLVLQETKHV